MLYVASLALDLYGEIDTLNPEKYTKSRTDEDKHLGSMFPFLVISTS